MSFFKKVLNSLHKEDEQVPANRPGRNESCWCGSGKKYKKCHLDADEQKLRATKASCACGPT